MVDTSTIHRHILKVLPCSPNTKTYIINKNNTFPITYVQINLQYTSTIHTHILSTNTRHTNTITKHFKIVNTNLKYSFTTYCTNYDYTYCTNTVNTYLPNITTFTLFLVDIRLLYCLSVH